MLALCSGCTSPWWNGYLDPTAVGNFHHNVLTEIQETVSFEDKPLGVPNAVDPTPDDLVATIEDYRLGPGDVLQIRVLDFLSRGTESEFSLTVADSGTIDMPQLGLVQVEGLALSEVQAELIRMAQAKGIFRTDVEPTITLSLASQQNRTFNISGSVQAPGPYLIPRSDFRLKEALNLSGGLENGLAGNVWQQQYVATIYVLRNEPRHKRTREPASRPTNANPPATHPPATLPGLPAVGTAVAGGPASQEGTAPAPQPSTRPRTGGLALPTEEAEQDLINAVAPAGAPKSASGQSRPASAPPSGESPSLRPFIFVNDRLIEAPATQQTTPPPPTTTAEAPKPATRETVDWQELAAEGQQRIIRIPAEALRSGDSSYNIVIRHQDWIRVDPGPVGSYYVGGHIVQPGSYPLMGQDITLVQAVIAARGLDPLAWPTRCEIRRRLDRDREQITQWDLARIMAGQDPDVYLRPNDVINIGTHALAPFILTIRNAFRFTYGLSFSYDRNWAEFDTLAGQYYRSRTVATQRGLLSAFTGE
jgi:polysaccharide biosynthesis/export protein